MARRSAAVRTSAAELPVARVCVDLSLPHLDRPFDYLVPAADSDAARPGTRVRVRFAGQRVDGWLLERVASSSHSGTLAYLERVVSPEPVLHPEVLRLARAVAQRYAGNLADVLRLAVPPRHARAERAAAAVPTGDGAPPTGASPAVPPASAVSPWGSPVAGYSDQPAPAGWSEYPAGPALLRALTDGRAPRAVWSALPGEDWPARVAEAVAATVAAGRGVVAVVADARDLARLDAAVARMLGAADGVPRHVSLSASLGPAERYRRFLRASRGEVPVVIGTRAAAFAPVPELGLVVIWDDGDDLHAEPRAPYPHAREVLLLRAQSAQAAALLGGWTRTAEAQQLVETGWAKPVVPQRAMLRQRAPRVVPVADDAERARDSGAAAARLPSVAWRAARDALAAGAPVLVQVPRRGYLPAVACVRCRAPVRCRHCAGPLQLPDATATAAACRWCGRPAVGHACAECGARGLRAAVTGARRTAEELGRAFPGYPVRTSGRDGVLDTVPDAPALVVATPGAEPRPAAGYRAVLLLDTWALLTRADLRAGEEALRRWSAAAALACPAGDGGTVVVVADGGLPVVQALVRSAPDWYAERELAERRALGFPPAARVATVTGPPAAVADLLAAAALPAETEQLGPVPVSAPDAQGASSASAAGGEDPDGAGGEVERVLLRVPRAHGTALAGALHAAAAVRSARKEAGAVRVQVDPVSLL